VFSSFGGLARVRWILYSGRNAGAWLESSRPRLSAQSDSDFGAARNRMPTAGLTDRTCPSAGADSETATGLLSVTPVAIVPSPRAQARRPPVGCRRGSGPYIPGRVAPGDCSPGAPTDPYVPFQAYGSSHHERATGRHTEWIATGGGSGYRPSIR
jgi:hypothetical protein